MVPEASSDPNRRSHLRLVGHGSRAEVASGRKHIEADGIPVLTPAEARAAGIRREALIFKSARASFVPKVDPLQTESSVEASDVGSAEPVSESIDITELGSRFEALAPSPQAAPSEAAGRIDSALESLRSTTESPSLPELWPVNHLDQLAAVDKASAGRWVIAMLTQLHRVQPSGILDLRMASGQTIRAVALGDETRIDWTASPSRRIPFVKVSEARLAELALGHRRPRRRQRGPVSTLRALAACPISVGDLGCAPGSVIDPFAFWQLVRIARPAAPEGIPALLTHVDPTRRVYDVTVDLTPGRPIQVRLGVDPDADAAVHTDGSDLLHWASQQGRPASGSDSLITGDADAELAALRAIGRSISPIRQSS
jgi:hypothetical protein